MSSGGVPVCFLNFSLLQNEESIFSDGEILKKNNSGFLAVSPETWKVLHCILRICFLFPFRSDKVRFLLLQTSSIDANPVCEWRMDGPA